MVSRLNYSILIFILLSGCQVYNSSTWDELKYAEISGNFSNVQLIFSAKCTPCHNFHTLTEQEMIDQNLLIAGDASNSSIFYRLKGSGSNQDENMAPSDQLTNEEIDTVKTWIDAM